MKIIKNKSSFLSYLIYKSSNLKKVKSYVDKSYEFGSDILKIIDPENQPFIFV